MVLGWVTVFLDFPADAFDAEVAFWQRATGSELSPYRGPEAEFATLLPASETGGVGASRVDTLCLDVPPADFERECSFWAALTGYETRPAPVAGFAILTGPPGMPARLLLQRLDAAAPGQRVRAHVDIGVTDRERAAAWHVTLGARVVETFPYWTVLADPAGRQYCLIGRDPG